MCRKNYSRLAKPGLTADLTLAEYPGRRFKVTFVDTSHAIAEASADIESGIRCHQQDRRSFCLAHTPKVHLQLPASMPQPTSFRLPRCCSRSEGLPHCTIIKDDNRAELLPVTLGRDFGGEVEVVSGLSGDEHVVISPPDSLVTGESDRRVYAQWRPDSRESGNKK